MENTRKRAFLSLALIAAGIVTMMIASKLDHHHAFIVGGIHYARLGGDSVEVIEKNTNKYSGNITIHPTITYHDTIFRVVGIGKDAFEDCAFLETVSIEEGIRYIGDYAFCCCKGLTRVSLPESVNSIGDDAFLKCDALSEPVCSNTLFAYLPKRYSGEYAIPEGIKYVAGYAFRYCDSLTNVTLPESVIRIGASAFSDSMKITMPILNSHVFALMPKDYEGEYSIPEGVTSVAGGAFRECANLTGVRLPESVKEVGLGAFRYCCFDEPIFNSTVFADMPNSSKYGGEFTFPSGTKVLAEGVLSGHICLEKVIIPEGVTSISREAFYSCKNLREVKIPNSVTRIEKKAFSSCPNLRSIEIPNSVVYIGEGAFEYSGLTSVTIPESVEIIDHDAFFGCENLKCATLKSRKTILYEHAFNYDAEVERPFSISDLFTREKFINYLTYLHIPDDTRSPFPVISVHFNRLQS